MYKAYKNNKKTLYTYTTSTKEKKKKTYKNAKADVKCLKNQNLTDLIMHKLLC